jgi:hypothetical protein
VNLVISAFQVAHLTRQHDQVLSEDSNLIENIQRAVTDLLQCVGRSHRRCRAKAAYLAVAARLRDFGLPSHVTHSTTCQNARRGWKPLIEHPDSRYNASTAGKQVSLCLC